MQRMKTLLCILLLSTATFGQIADARRQDRREEHEFPGVLLAPSADQTITGAHSLILQTGVESLKLFPGFQENHSAFALASDLYTHNDQDYLAPYINFNKSRGTQENPTPVRYAGYEVGSIGGINFRGWDGSQYITGPSILTQVDEEWTPTNHGSHLSIYGIDAGSVVHGPQIIQFGGVGPSGEPNTNIITYRGISFKGANSSNAAINNFGGPVPTLAVQRADGSGDAAWAAGILIETIPHTPSSAFDTGTPGQIAWDANYVYVCIAPNTWRRSALAAW
jgi:hypothetical protein